MRGIYVERTIRTDMDRLWAFTQMPELHALWDVRFSFIEALPNEPGAFARSRYVTELGFGVRIVGYVDLLGVASKLDGSRSSKIRFSSSDPKSLIRSGTGYWRYVPSHHGIRFISYFDYVPRYGAIGRVFDIAFRPLVRWLTVRSLAVLARRLEAADTASSTTASIDVL